MELNITRFFNTESAFDYSASCAEIGDDAGKRTWNNAVIASHNHADLLDTDDKKDTFRAYVKTFGAWDENEIAAWTDNELTALLIQLISASMRENGLDSSEPDWEAYESDDNNSGDIFRSGDEVYFYIGS